MASVHRQKGRPFYYAAFTDAEGVRRFKSTGQTRKAEAEVVARAFEKAAKKAKRGNLSIESARRIVEEAVSEIAEGAGIEMPRSTIGAHVAAWLRERTGSTSDSTAQKYKGVADAFLKHLGRDASRPLAWLTVEHVQQFRDAIAEHRRASTANGYLKILRVILKDATRKKLLESNPAALVPILEARREASQRRAFTLPELRRLLDVAGAGDWRTMILSGLYTGLRLGDIVGLTWRNIDLATREITVRTGKTHRDVSLPIAAPMLAHLETLAGDDPDAPLCPALCGLDGSTLSRQFRTLMEHAAIVQRQDARHVARKRGRSVRRELGDVTFHCLRHTATSLLKNAGVSDAVARDIIGHESPEVSRAYTHIDAGTKRAAVDKLPDITT